MSVIKRVQGKTYPLIDMVLKDSNTNDPYDALTWDVLDLTGLTVTLEFRKKGTAVIIDTITGVLVTGGADGRVTFLLTNTAVDAAIGLYEGQIVIDYGAGNQAALYDTLDLDFRADF